MKSKENVLLVYENLCYYVSTFIFSIMEVEWADVRALSTVRQGKIFCHPQ